MTELKLGEIKGLMDIKFDQCPHQHINIDQLCLVCEKHNSNW